MKALGLVLSEKTIFENCIFKTYFLWGPPRVYPVEFGQIPISGSREEVI